MKGKHLRERCRRMLLMFMAAVMAVTGISLMGASQAVAVDRSRAGGYCPELERIDGNVGDSWRTAKSIRYSVWCYRTLPDEQLLYMADAIGTRRFVTGSCGPTNVGISKTKWFGPNVHEYWYPTFNLTPDTCGRRRDWTIRFNVIRYKYCPCSKTWKEVERYNFGYDTFSIGRNSSATLDLTPGAPDAYPTPQDLLSWVPPQPPLDAPAELFDPPPPGY